MSGKSKQAAAWLLVMGSYEDLSRYSRQICAKALTLQHDDLLNHAIVTCIERFDCFDPEQGAFTKWAYWQTRRAATTLLRQAGASTGKAGSSSRAVLCGMDPSQPDVLSFMPATSGTADSVETLAEIALQLRSATDEETSALLSKAEGLSASEVMDTLGLTMAGRNQRIYRFRRRLGDSV